MQNILFCIQRTIILSLQDTSSLGSFFMYIPKFHSETNTEALYNLIEENPLGIWTHHNDGKLTANHLPFLLAHADNQPSTLITHVSKANPIWQSASLSKEPSLIIFQGVNTYISPSWYMSKKQHGKVVPTWNYIAVHVHGTAKIHTDPDWLRAHIESATNHHESNQDEPWKVDDAPSEFISAMINGIVGIEITIEEIVGKWKTSQNRSQADREGVINGLSQSENPSSIKMAEIIEQANKHLDTK